jgi:SNF2 family DNA or RNA helicase
VLFSSPKGISVQIIDNRALLFTTKKADQITALIPKSRVLERNGELARVLVNWGPDEAKLLRNLRIKNVPHPITGRYKWAGVYTPFAHQRVTAGFLATHQRCLVLSEAGTGKTAAAAWAADYLMQQGEVKRVLIVCPVSIMDTAWRADLFRTVMHRTVAIASGSRERREKLIDGDYEFVIINFDGVKVVRTALEAAAFDLIIVDEATALKNVQTDRWKALNGLLKPTTRLWLMTGTPASQSPVDAYGLAKLVAPERMPRFYGTFRDSVMYKVTQYKWAAKRDAQDTVFKALQPAIRYTKEECLDLPDMLYTSREVPLTVQQQKYYDVIKKSMVALAAGSEITAVNAAGLLNKLLQISQGVAYTTDKEVVEFDVSNRLNELDDVIQQTTHKVIVFIPFRHAMEKVQDELSKRGYASDSIHGGVPASQRADIIKRFQTEASPRIILLIPQAAAHGITLTAADTVVWWGPTSSAEMYIQGNSRAHRAGQTNKVTVVRLQGSPVERRMYDMLDGKVDMHQGLVDLYKQEIA